MTPIIGDLIESTVGKIIGGLTDRYLPASMSEQEKADFKLEAEKLVVTELEANKSIIEAVNQTMQAESKSDNWWTSGWRPYWGFISGTAFLAVCVFICYLMYEAIIGGKPEMMAHIPQVIGAFAALFAIPGAILGVTAWHRGKMQRIHVVEVTGDIASLVADLRNLIKSGK